MKGSVDKITAGDTKAVCVLFIMEFAVASGVT